MTKEQFANLQLGDKILRVQGRDDVTEQNVLIKTTHWFVSKITNNGKEVHIRKGRYRKIIMTQGTCAKFELLAK